MNIIVDPAVDMTSTILQMRTFRLRKVKKVAGGHLTRIKVNRG